MLTLLLVCVVGVSCTPAPLGPPVRFIADEPTDLFVPELAAGGIEPVFTWTFETAEDLEPYEGLGNPQSFRLEDGGLRILARAKKVRLIRPVNIQADSLHMIRVKLTGLRKGKIGVYWKGTKQSFNPNRRIKLDQYAGVGDEVKVFEFAVGSHPTWEGKIARLRIDPTDAAGGEEVKILEISGFRLLPSPTGLAEVSAKAWKMDIGADVRDALIGVSGLPHEQSLTVPAASRLQFSYGIKRYCGLADDDIEVIFKVLLRRGMRTTEIFKDVLSPRDAQSRERWHEASVDLTPYEGRDVELVLDTSGIDAAEAAAIVPVWANPRVVPTLLPNRPPNIVFICIDTLRADRLSLYGNPRRTSPALDAWAERLGATFRTTVAQAPWTFPSHVSMFTGLTPMRHGANYSGPASDSFEMLAELLRRNGYTTTAITGGGWLHPKYGFAQGFDSYRYWPDTSDETELEDGMARALASLERNSDQPFLLFFHTYETHGPYLAREPYFSSFYEGTLEQPDRHLATRSRPVNIETGFVQFKEFVWRHEIGGPQIPLPDGMQTVVKDLYDSGVAYMDHHVGQLLDRLRELGLEENTLVIFTSDHGESLGERGLAGHGHLYDENLLVPLVIALPGRIQGGTHIPKQVRSVDIMPTILELVGIEVPAELDGVSLLPLLDGNTTAVPFEAWSYAASSNHGVSLRVDNELKYILSTSPWPPTVGGEKLFLLADDPGELFDVSATAPEKAVLRDRTLGVLRDKPGLRVRISNAAAEMFQGTFSGGLVRALALKADTPVCDSCMEWAGKKEARFSARAGESFTIAIEDVRPGVLGIEGFIRTAAGRQPVPFSAQLEPEEISRPWALAFNGTEWEPAALLDVLEGTGIAVWWQGDMMIRGASPEESDPEIMKRLRALGYVQ